MQFPFFVVKKTPFFTVLFLLNLFQKNHAQTFKFFQPQEKRDSVLPIFEKNVLYSYQIKSTKQSYENGEKTGKSVEKFAMGFEVKEILEKQLKVAFITTKKQLCKRTYGDFFSTDSLDTQPIQLIFTIEKNTKLINIENYKNIVNLLLIAIENAANKEIKYKSDIAFYNKIEKLKFDLKNGNEKLMQSTFLDITFFFSAYNFPIYFDKPTPFLRSDYEYFAASRPCIFEYKKISNKQYFNVKYDKKSDTNAKSVKDALLKDFDYRYSVIFDEKNLPQSVGLFLSQKTDNQSSVETWTLSKQK
jgi:hypothetical protein